MQLEFDFPEILASSIFKQKKCDVPKIGSQIMQRMALNEICDGYSQICVAQCHSNWRFTLQSKKNVYLMKANKYNTYMPIQKYSRLRQPLWKFSSLYKAEALFEGM